MTNQKILQAYLIKINLFRTNSHSAILSGSIFITLEAKHLVNLCIMVHIYTYIFIVNDLASSIFRFYGQLGNWWFLNLEVALSDQCWNIKDKQKKTKMKGNRNCRHTPTPQLKTLLSHAMIKILCYQTKNHAYISLFTIHPINTVFMLYHLNHLSYNKLNIYISPDLTFHSLNEEYLAQCIKGPLFL